MNPSPIPVMTEQNTLVYQLFGNVFGLIGGILGIILYYLYHGYLRRIIWNFIHSRIYLRLICSIYGGKDFKIESSGYRGKIVSFSLSNSSTRLRLSTDVKQYWINEVSSLWGFNAPLRITEEIGIGHCKLTYYLEGSIIEYPGTLYEHFTEI